MTATIRSKLHPDVLALVEQGKLHPFDAEWICNLPRVKQMAAARKCLSGDFWAPREGRPVWRGDGKVYL